MGVYVRRDSPCYWMLLEGHATPAGRPLRESTGIRRDSPTPQLRKDAHAQAFVAYHERLLALARGDGEAPAKKLATSFPEFVAWFRTHVLPLRRGHEREVEILPRLVAFFGRYPLTAIDRALVREYMTWRLNTPIVIPKKRRTRARIVKAGPSTINREVDVLKAILQAAVPKYLKVSPLYGMKRLETVTPQRRLMTEDEERRLLAVMTPVDTAFFLIGLDSLVRLSDILDVRWSDYTGASLWIADPKTGGGFEVPLSQRARTALDAIRPPKLSPRARAAYIFARRRRAKTERDRRKGIRQMLARYCAEATPPIQFGRKRGGLSFHWATRRTGATRMLTRNVDIGTVQKVGHWKSPDVVLGIYHELLDEHAYAAVESVSAPHQNAQPKKSRKSLRKRT